SMYTTFPGDKIPIYRDIRLNNIVSTTPGYVTYLGVDDGHRVQVLLNNVSVPALQATTEHAEVSSGAGLRPVRCSFPSFPAALTAPVAPQTILPEDPTFYVAASGTGDYWSIQKAIDMAPEGATISIAPGIYRERLNISKPNIHLRSPYTDAKRTVIVFDAS